MGKDKDKKKFKQAQQTLASLWLVRQTDGGHGAQHRRPAARVDGRLQRLRRQDAGVHRSWKYDRCGGASAFGGSVFGGPCFRQDGGTFNGSTNTITITTSGFGAIVMNGGTFNGGTGTVTFTGTLQSATSLSGPWTGVATTSPYVTTATGTARYFRAQD